MTNNTTMLAAVRTAATEPQTELAVAPAGSQEKETSMADAAKATAPADMISKADHEALLAAAQTAAKAEKDTAVAAAKAEGIKEGAAAENARIVGIEAHAMPGHENLIAEMKADGKTTPDQAAGRILAAERATRAGHLQAVKDVEKEGAKVPASPSASAAHAAETSKAATPEGWKAEYEVSAALKGEYPTVESYVAFKKADAAGKVHILGARKSA